ncbi:hypothetical protein P4H32_26405 [Bacillus cereus]|nr:hypothetical protein [Bacillus cereus]
MAAKKDLTCRECACKVNTSRKKWNDRWGLCGKCYLWYKRIGNSLANLKV